jgi:cytochrome c oxidase assembly protein subunit 17
MGSTQTKGQSVAVIADKNLPIPATVENGEIKPKCKPCCACPQTKQIRDECVLLNGQENCSKEIEAHIACMRAAGFNI